MHTDWNREKRRKAQGKLIMKGGDDFIVNRLFTPRKQREINNKPERF